MGITQGQAFAAEIRTALDVVAELEAFRLTKPRLIPRSVHLAFAEHLAGRFLRRAFHNVPLAAAERLQGIADGAQLSVRKIALCAGLEPVLSDLQRASCVPPTYGCSAVGITREASFDRMPILAHNFDYLPIIQQFYAIRRSIPQDGLRSLELTVMPVPGAISGINQAGLAVTCNYAYAADTRGVAGPPITMLISEALCRCRTISELSAYLQQTHRAGGGLLLAADESGRIAALEISNSLVRECSSVRDRLFRSNRYRHPDLTRHEISADACYGRLAPAALRGKRVHESADRRDAELERLLESREQFSAADVEALMSDHGPDLQPSEYTVCVHSAYWHTTASLQLMPAERMLRAAFSPTCVAQYQDFVI